MDNPYGKCTTRKFLDNVNNQGEEFDYNYKYGSSMATARCKQLHTIQTCNCIHPYLPMTPEIFSHYFQEKGVESCLAHLLMNPNIDITEMYNSINCFHGLSFDVVCNDYLPPCEENVYSYQYHQTTWPHESYELAFYREVISPDNDSRTDKFGDRFSIYENISRLMESNPMEGTALLRQEDLIERNFIQLTARFQVRYILFNLEKKIFFVLLILVH